MKNNDLRPFTPPKEVATVGPSKGRRLSDLGLLVSFASLIICSFYYVIWSSNYSPFMVGVGIPFSALLLFVSLVARLAGGNEGDGVLTPTGAEQTNEEID